MASKTLKVNEYSFEEALTNLEELVGKMEEGNLTLDEALAKFEEGIRLSRICSTLLEKAEKKVEMLLVSDSGEFQIKPTEIPED